MRTFGVLALFVALLLGLAPARAAEGPLAPLAPVAKHLQDGAAAFLAGKSLADAFTPWKVEGEDAEKTAALRKQVQDAGAKSIRAVFMELEFLLMKGDRQVLLVRTAVWPDPAGPVLLHAEGRVVVDETPPTLPAPADMKGASKPLGEAATALWKALASDGWKTLPWAEASQWEALLPEGPIRRGGVEALAEIKEKIEETAKMVAAAGADSIRVRVDDVGFLPLDAAGKGLGELSAELDLDDADASLAFSVNNFKPFGGK
jgi:hypothetical protein